MSNIMQKRQVLINAVFSILQIVVVSAVLFVLYHYLLDTIGVRRLGIWSLVLATTSVAQISNMGLAGSVVKFVAKYTALGDEERVSYIIQTAAISLSAFVAIILITAYPIVKKVMAVVVEPDFYVLAIEVLPYALLALWFVVVTSVFYAALDGRQRIDIRSGLLMGSSLLNLILCFVLVPIYGLLGVAYARVIQVSLMFLVSWLLLKKYVSLPLFPCKWKREVFREIAVYGLSFQAISVSMLFYDPVTKSLLSKFGDLSMVGYYEMASRLIQQLRSLMISANRVLVPAIADLNEKAPEAIKSLYLISYRLLFFFSLPLYTLIVLGLPIISEFWIGHYERSFVVFGTLLALGWFVNTLNVPAYFANLGTGYLRWNVVGHITIMVLNVIFGFLLGLLKGGIGVVIAWVVSLALGSSVIYISYHVKYGIPVSELLPRESRGVSLVCLFGVLLAVYIQCFGFCPVCKFAIVVFFLFPLSLLLYFHPMRKRLFKWIVNDLILG